MKRQPLYSSGRARRVGGAAPTAWAGRRPEGPPLPPEPAFRETLARRWRGFSTRFEKALLILGGGAMALAVMIAYLALQPRAKVHSQADIDAAVAYSLKRRPNPSPAAVAAEAIGPSVVRVSGYDPDKAGRPKKDTGVAPEPGAKAEDAASLIGSGVVIDERGTILTNFHVAAAAEKLTVTFANGLVSEADFVGAQPEDDLAVIRARTLPDDLKPATLVSTAGLKPGDEVVAVGFPFAIGPSVSAGVVSGLKREWVFDEKRRARNLIQFDAAANPGNSGGPLVNRKGEVLGIVTGILNPTKQRVFIGIGFAVPIENAARAVGRSPF